MITAKRIKSKGQHNTGKWHIVRNDDSEEVTSMCGLVQLGERKHHSDKQAEVTATVEADSLDALEKKINSNFGELCGRCSNKNVRINEWKIKKLDEDLREEVKDFALEEGVPVIETTEYLVRKGLEAHKSESSDRGEVQ